MGGLRRYLLTYIDEVSGYALAMAVPKLSSQTAKVFFEKCFRLTPFHIQQVVTGGGSEFKGAFDRLLSDSQIVHLLTYPKSPKMNATCERFNRTIQEQFVDFHEDLLFTDLRLFNEKLAEWLFKYNTIRPHKGLDLQTPVQYIINHNQKCSLGWTHTFSGYQRVCHAKCGMT